MLFSTVALSVILSFLVTELTGLLTGGMVSAGYLAFYFSEPMRILSTFLLSALIALILRLSREFLILYGRRRFMLSILRSSLHHRRPLPEVFFQCKESGGRSSTFLLTYSSPPVHLGHCKESPSGSGSQGGDNPFCPQ